MFLCSSPATWLTKTRVWFTQVPVVVALAATANSERVAKSRPQPLFCWLVRLAGWLAGSTCTHTHMPIGNLSEPASQLSFLFNIHFFFFFNLFYWIIIFSPFFHLFSISVARFIHPFIELVAEPIQLLPLYLNIYSLFALLPPYSPSGAHFSPPCCLFALCTFIFSFSPVCAFICLVRFIKYFCT